MPTKNIIFLVLFFAHSAFAETPTDPKPEIMEAQNEPERVGRLDTEQLAQLALSEAAKPNELVWLKVNYPERDDAVNVLALEQKPRVAAVQGAVLILHDTEQHADWPYFIRPLRENLPDAGWHTLSVNLPYENPHKSPERSIDVKKTDQIIINDQLSSALQMQAVRKVLEDKPSQQDSEDAVAEEAPSAELDEVQINGEQTQAVQTNEKVDIDLKNKDKTKKKMLSYNERALLHTGAAIDYLRGEGFQNIIIVGYRAGADAALDYIKPNVPKIPSQGFALVMVDPILNAEYQTGIADFFGDNFQAPILDIANGASLESKALAQERAVGARVAELANYHQVSLTVNQSGAFQQSLIRRIRYWLVKYAPGMVATSISPP